MATDYLALLPTELLIVICDLVHETHPRQYLGRVSKAFLPLERDRTFRHLRITSYKSLARLVEAINTSPGAGVHVATLHVKDGRHRSQDFPPDSDFTAFLRHLPHLEEVEFNAILPAERLRHALKAGHLPALHSVTVGDPLHCRSAAPLVKLVSLTGMGSIRQVSVTFKIPDLRLFSMRSGLGQYLSLQGDLAGWADLAGFLASLPPLETLRLNQRALAPAGHLLFLLRSLAHPLSLGTLEIRQHSSLADDLSAVLHIFPFLRALELGAGISTANLLPALRTLPRLSRLNISYGAPLASAHLLALIDAIAVRTLRAIEVGVYVVHSALSTNRDDGTERDEGWTGELTLEGMIKVVAAADRARVRIYGLSIDRAREELRRRARMGAEDGMAVD
ncbi:hypothetical protein JCM10449v2_007366 [Rhodotorula kratochvilovae]